MDTINKIKELCDLNSISIRKLEKDLGYGNGSIMKAKSLTFDRVYAIAEYFHVPLEYFSSDEDIDSSHSLYDSEEIKKAMKLYRDVNALTPSDQLAIRTLIASLPKSTNHINS